MGFVDLRSDTVTRPTPGMRRAIAEAEVGDDVFGDDPTVKALEERIADLLGKEAALFLPSGTMANEVAVAAHTERGDEVLLEENSHVFLYEGGGPALLSGVQLRPLPGDRGLPDRETVLAALRPRDPHFPRSRLLVLENTHNRAGGRVLPLESLEGLCRAVTERGLRTHLDGARLWNAAVATGIPESRWAAPFDSVSVCLSKGLGAPVGSVLAGPAAFIDLARHYRKRFGGGMRQVGLLAAAGLYALDHHRERLAEDHRRAAALASALEACPGLSVDAGGVETNIVLADVTPSGRDAAWWVKRLRAHGVLVVAMGPRTLRCVTHLDVDDEGLRRAVEAFRAVAREAQAS
jgi:threonine aldolase